MATENKRMQQRRNSAANWTSDDPTLLVGEFGIEMDTGKFKIGDGLTAWTSLPYATYTVAQLIASFDAEGSATAAQSAAETTAASALAAHAADSTSVHGIADTADLLTTADLTSHVSDTTSIHGIPDTAVMAIVLRYDSGWPSKPTWSGVTIWVNDTDSTAPTEDIAGDIVLLNEA